MAKLFLNEVAEAKEEFTLLAIVFQAEYRQTEFNQTSNFGRDGTGSSFTLFILCKLNLCAIVILDPKASRLI